MFKRSQHGFTLVELIVVIAILGILAGIAIPVYSGYIKKANQAADEQLLSAVNTAFAAACLEKGFYTKDLSDANLEVTADKTITGVESVSGVSCDVEALSDAFEMYYGGNTETKLKYFTGVSFDISKHVFVGTKDGAAVTNAVIHENGIYSLTITNGRGTATLNVTDAQMAALLASTYGNGSMPVDELMGDVGAMVGSAFNVLDGGGTTAAFMQAIGVDLAALGIEPLDDEDHWPEDKLANAAVLLVADRLLEESDGNPDETMDYIVDYMMSSPDFDGLTANMTGLQVTDDLGNPISNPTDAQYANAVGRDLPYIAAFYAVATGFVNSSASEGQTVTVDGASYTAKQYYELVNQRIAAAASAEGDSPQVKIRNIMSEMAGLTNLMQDEPDGEFNSAYSQYIASSQMSNDVAGFFSAMEVVNGNQDAMVVAGTIDEGFNNALFSSVLQQFLAAGTSG